MIVIGLILAGAASAIAIDVWLENTPAMISVQAFGHTWSQPVWVLVLVGVAVGFGGLLGLLIAATGARRAQRLRAERRSMLRDRERRERESAAVPAAAQPGSVTDSRVHATGAAPATAPRRRGLFRRGGQHAVRS